MLLPRFGFHEPACLGEKKLGALRLGAISLGSPLVRNRATIGGNIGSARPAADLPSPLIAYGATVTLESRHREREIPLSDFSRRRDSPNYGRRRF